MKKFNKIFAICAILLLSFLSCEKDERHNANLEVNNPLGKDRELLAESYPEESIEIIPMQSPEFLRIMAQFALAQQQANFSAIRTSTVDGNLKESIGSHYMPAAQYTYDIMIEAAAMYEAILDEIDEPSRIYWYRRRVSSFGFEQGVIIIANGTVVLRDHLTGP